MLRSDDELVIGEHNWRKFARAPRGQGFGLVPRDWKKTPLYAGASAVVDFPLIPRSEWAERAADQIKNKSRLSDIRMRGNNGKPIPSRDQNGRGYCWAHSGTSALLLLRA